MVYDAGVRAAGGGPGAIPAMREFDPYAYETHEDPYPIYAELRAEAPVYRNERLGFWALSRHADVLAAFRDAARFSNRHGVSLDPAATHPGAQATSDKAIMKSARVRFTAALKHAPCAVDIGRRSYRGRPRQRYHALDGNRRHDIRLPGGAR